MTEARRIVPCGPVHGPFHVPGSKSLTNRALVCAALARGTSVLLNASDSQDSALMANGLNQLGVLVRREGSRWEVEGKGGKLYAPRFPIPVGNAGTTLRFFLALSGLAEGRVILEGSPRMRERPNEELIDVLQKGGIAVRQDPEFSRYEVTGGTFRGGRLSIKQDRSSQFLSALLLIAPRASAPVEVLVEGPRISGPYVRMTLEVMRAFGAVVENRPPSGGSFSVQAPQKYAAREYAIEPDASGASYGLGAAAITGGEVLVEGLRLASSQGDAAFSRLLAQMGCAVEESAQGLRLTGTRALTGIDVEMNGMPDAVPTLAAVALFAATPTRIRNVAHLRFKESDRIDALATEFRKLGGSVVVYEDGLEITPTPLHGGTVATYDDHRMAMAAALIGLRVPGVEVENPACVQKSFPLFWVEFDRLCATGVVP
jgi:3-phosphoshikimate 1-carboxyvinyltransferase